MCGYIFGSFKFQIENRKIERGIPEMPFSSVLVEITELKCIESNFGNIS